jgi:hypothetical protein
MSKGGYWTKHLLVIATAGLALHLPAAVSAADCEHCVEDEIECQQIYSIQTTPVIRAKIRTNS